MPDPTPLLALDRDSLRALANRLDVMGGLIATFAPDDATTDPGTLTFGYRGGRFIDDLGAVGFEPDGTIVVPNNVVRYVHFDPVNGVTLAAAIDRTKFVIAEVSTGTAAPGTSTFHIEDLRDINLVAPERTRWRGVWAAGTYLRNDMVIAGGALYVANTTTTATPPNADWDLVVSGSALDVEDEGTLEEAAVTRLNFIGPGVSAVGDGVGGVDVTITGTSSMPPVDLALFHRFNMILSVPGSNTPQLIGFTDPNGSGTATSPARSTANFNASQKRIRQTSAAGTNEGAGRIYAAGNEFFTLGDAAGVGGFTVVLRFGLVTLAAGCRGFFGLCRVSPIANADPDTKIDILGMGWRDTDSNWHLIHNDGSGTATMVDTGVAFAVDICYEVEIDAGPNSSAVFVRLYSVNGSGRTLLYQGNPTTDLPTGSLFMAPSAGINTAAGVSAIAMDFHHWIGDTR